MSNPHLHAQPKPRPRGLPKIVFPAVYRALNRAGTRIPTSSPMIAITTRISMRAKAWFARRSSMIRPLLMNGFLRFERD